MKIFDCFIFFNELELLDLRLMVLNEYVDFFVLVEANKTHTGKKKEFIFEQNRDKFSDYINKIIYVKVEDLPDYSEDSPDSINLPEFFQRNCIMRGLKRAILGDKIIISDVDEIPNPKVIKKHLDSQHPVTMEQKLFYYYVNCLQNQLWRGPILTTYNVNISPQQLRSMARGGCNVVSGGGWHYSFMGGPKKIKNKVENIRESRLIIDRVGSISDIERKTKNQQDLWNRTDYSSQKQIVDIGVEGIAPECIDWFIEKYPDFFFVV